MGKILEGRIQHKKDTLSNWETTNPVLLDGELVIVVLESGKELTKLGDGETPFRDLPYNGSASAILRTWGFSTDGDS